MQSPSDDNESFIPKSILERTFIQARYMNSMHQWRKGTTELMSGKVGQATGFYLAMSRTQCIDGTEAQAAATLDCIWDYHKRLSNADKFSVIRVICNILEEQNIDGTEKIIANEPVRSRFLRISVALAGQLNEDKVAQVEALTLIKKATHEDLIGASVRKKLIASLEHFIEKCKPELLNQPTSFQKMDSELSKASKAILTTIFDQVDLLAPHINVFLVLTKLAKYLLYANLQTEAVTVCSYLRSYCLNLPEKKLSSNCGEEISRIFEKALTDPDGVNSFILDTTLQDLKLRNYLTASKTVATCTFEEHFVSWSKSLEANKFGFTTPESTRNLQNSEQSVDLVVANALNYLADQLTRKNEYEEASACSHVAVLKRIQCQRIDQRDVEDLSVLAAMSLISKRYERALELLSEVRTTLQFSTYDAIWYQRLNTYTSLLEQLFGQLAEEDCKLSIKSYSTISYVVVLYSRIAMAPEHDTLLERALELLRARIDQPIAEKVFRLFWRDLTRLPIRKIFESYVESLATLTENTVDQTSANACYLDFLENFQNRALATQLVIPLFNKILQARDIGAKKHSLTELPLVSALLMLNLELGNNEKCKISSEEFRAISTEFVDSKPSEVLKLQCVKAFFQIEEVFLRQEKSEPHSFDSIHSTAIAHIIKEITRVDFFSTESHTELCFLLCDFLLCSILSNVRIPKQLLDTVQNFDSEMLVETFGKLEQKCSSVDLIELLEVLIEAKQTDSQTADALSIIPLVLRKAKYLQKIGKFKELDKVYLQIITLEKQITDDSNAAAEGCASSKVLHQAVHQSKLEAEDRVFQTQMDFLHSLTSRREFDLAFELAFEMITRSKTKTLDCEQASLIFETIDSFARHQKYSNSIELMAALISRVQMLEFDHKMLATFDLVFVNCLQQNMFEKAQFLLNKAKNLTKTGNNDDSERNFIQEAATRYTNAFPDREAFRFDKLNTALDDLRKKKVFCNDLELFVTIVFKRLENDFTYPDDATPHSPPD